MPYDMIMVTVKVPEVLANLTKHVVQALDEVGLQLEKEEQETSRLADVLQTVKQELATEVGKVERLTEELDYIRERFGLTNPIDYERFKAGLPSLGPINKTPKLTWSKEEVLAHIRDTMPL